MICIEFSHTKKKRNKLTQSWRPNVSCHDFPPRGFLPLAPLASLAKTFCFSCRQVTSSKYGHSLAKKTPKIRLSILSLKAQWKLNNALPRLKTSENIWTPLSKRASIGFALSNSLWNKRWELMRTTPQLGKNLTCWVRHFDVQRAILIQYRWSSP